MSTTHDHAALARTVLTREDGDTRPATTLEPVLIGMSDAAVFRANTPGHPPRYVKVAAGTAAIALRSEIERTQWLSSRGIAVPQVIRTNDSGDTIAMLMAEVSGVSADVTPLPTPLLVESLAKALAALHAMPPETCPFDESLAARLTRAEIAIAAGDINADEFEPRNLSTTPEDLLRRLQAERPFGDDSVVLHGDATLGNIIIDDSGTVGFIDCGNAGRGDRYTDLALLHADIVEHRGAAAGQQFATAYGLARLDMVKARYFLDLYELF